jgi:hypothetical protein
MTKKSVKIVKSTGSKMLSEHVEALPVSLTQEELLSRATSLVRLRDEERTAEAEFEKHKTAHKERVASIAEVREQLEQAIRERREPRPVRVIATAHYDIGRLREVRDDTGELLNERPLTPDEMQEELPLHAGEASP